MLPGLAVVAVMVKSTSNASPVQYEVVIAETVWGPPIEPHCIPREPNEVLSTAVGDALIATDSLPAARQMAVLVATIPAAARTL